jgi:hypothetical protein
MALSEQTRLELIAIRQGVALPEEYGQFMIHWIAFNRAYNELRSDEDESNRVLGVGDELRQHWSEIIAPATALVRLECIGGESMPRQTLLRPTRWVKSATIYLREQLKIRPSFPECARDASFCREHKAAICQPVGVDPWGRSEMAALLRLVYQVRCNLFHGEKRLGVRDIQTNRDKELVTVSIIILNTVFKWLGES